MTDFWGSYDSDEYGRVPFDPDSKPGGELGEIFSDNGWVTWSDFYDDKVGLSSGDPGASRPPLLGDIEEILIDFNDRGILDWARFEFRDDGFIDYEIDVDS